eukprot:106066_1
MSDRQMLNIVYKECLQSCEELQEQVTKKRQELQGDTFQTEFSQKKIRSDFRIRRTLTGHYGKIYAIHWSLNNETGVCSASQDGKLMVWNAHTENKLIAIPLKSAWVMTCAYSPSGVYVTCGGLDNRVSIYRLNEYSQSYGTNDSKKIKPYVELEQHEGYISCIRFLDDSHIISSSGDSTLLLWDIEKAQPVSHFMDHTADVMSVALWQERSVFVSVSCDNTAKIWDVRNSNKCVGNFTGHKEDVNCCDWFPDGYAFATGSDDQSARLFDTRAYRELKSYASQNVNCGITSLKFTKSGRYLLTGYDDPPFMISWSTLSATATQTFHHLLKHRVSCLDLNCSGRAFATGSWDHNIRVWS